MAQIVNSSVFNMNPKLMASRSSTVRSDVPVSDSISEEAASSIIRMIWSPNPSYTLSFSPQIELITGLGKSPSVRKTGEAWDRVHAASKTAEGLFLGIGGAGFTIVRVQSLLVALETIGAPLAAAPIFMMLGVIGFIISMGFTAVVSGVNAYRGWRLGTRLESMLETSDPNKYAQCLEFLQKRAQDPVTGERLKKLLHPKLIDEILNAKPADAKLLIEKVQADRAKRVKMALVYLALSILGSVAMGLMLKYVAGPIFIIASLVTFLVTVAWPIGELMEVRDAYKNQEVGRQAKLVMVLSTLMLIGSVVISAVLGEKDPKSHLAVLGAGLIWLATQVAGTLVIKAQQARDQENR